MTYTGFKPHPAQREIINGILNGPQKFHIVSVGRQFGKSLMGQNLALYWAINNGPCKILWVSPVYSQSNKVLKELLSAIRDSGLIKTANLSENSILLKNGSEILFRSAERYDTIRGLTCDYGILDECAFIKTEAWDTAIRPVFAVRGKKVLFISTPKGKNFFYDLFQLGCSADRKDRYASYTGASADSPYMDPLEISDAQRTLPPAIFAQEYLAKFNDSGGEVFVDLDHHTLTQWPKANGRVYCGIDLGRAEDWTVATFMDSTGQVLEIYRQRQVQWTTMTSEILTLLKKWNATAMVEVNSIGDVIYEQLKDGWRDTHPFTTTGKSKPEIIEGLILDFSEGRIKIPHPDLFPHLYHELGLFSYSYNPKSRSVKYGAPAPHHDDTVMSLAIVNYNRKQNLTLGKYAVGGVRLNR